MIRDMLFVFMFKAFIIQRACLLPCGFLCELRRPSTFQALLRLFLPAECIFFGVENQTLGAFKPMSIFLGQSIVLIFSIHKLVEDRSASGLLILSPYCRVKV